MNKPTLRVMQETDLPAVAALHQHSFEVGWDAQSLRGLWASGVRGWVMEQASAIIAFLLTRTMADEAEIISIATAADHRRSGFAKQLLQHAEDALKREGVTTLFLEVRADHDEPQNLYAEFGYETIATRKDYYRTATGEMRHARVMRKILSG